MNPAPSIWRDSITLKAVLERWPVRSWFSPKHRVLFAAKRLHDAAHIDPQLSIVKKKQDLPTHAAGLDHAERDRVHGIIAVEGLSSLDNDISNVDRFYEAGVRIMYVTCAFASGLTLQLPHLDRDSNINGSVFNILAYTTGVPRTFTTQR